MNFVISIKIFIFLCCVCISLGFKNRIAPLKIIHSSLYSTKQVEITFEGDNKKTVMGIQGELIESVAKKAGVYIPFKCKQGRCGSCEVRLNGRGPIIYII